MKRLILCAMFGAVVGQTMAVQPSVACAAKRADIEAQLSEATAHGRKQEIAGLQKALRANKANCTDESLAKDREKDIKQAQKKVAEREQSLAEAKRKGDPKKIADREAKLDVARRELTRAETPIAR
jgi:hypothetical protein